HAAVDRQTLPLAQPFVAAEEERPVFENGATQRAAELISLERRFGAVEEVARVELLVAQELKRLAVKFVRAGARGDIDDGAGVAPVLSAVGRVVNFEFPHSVDRKLERNLILNHVVQVDAINHEVDSVFARAGGVERKRALPAQRSCQKSVLWRGDRAGYQGIHPDRTAAILTGLRVRLFI